MEYTELSNKNKNRYNFIYIFCNIDILFPI